MQMYKILTTCCIQDPLHIQLDNDRVIAFISIRYIKYIIINVTTNIHKTDTEVVDITQNVIVIEITINTGILTRT